MQLKSWDWRNGVGTTMALPKVFLRKHAVCRKAKITTRENNLPAELDRVYKPFGGHRSLVKAILPEIPMTACGACISEPLTGFGLHTIALALRPGL